MSQFFGRAALAAFLCTAPAMAQVSDLAKKFGEREAFNGVALSPDGTRISYLNPIAGKGSALVVVDLKTSAMKAVLSTGDPTLRLSWCYWVKNDRIACSIRGERQAIGENHSVSRIVAVDANGGNIKEIGARPNRRSIGLNAYGGSIIDHLPDDPDNILMMVYKMPEESVGTLMADTEGGVTVARVNVRTGRTQHIESPEPNGGGFDSDGRGNVRLKTIVSTQGAASGATYVGDRLRWFVRPKGSRTWVAAGLTDLSANQSLEVLGFDGSGDNLLLLRPHNGRQALFRKEIGGSGGEELIFAHDKVDVDGLRRVGRYSRPVSVHYSTDFNHVFYLDAALGKLAASIGKALPGTPEVTILDETWDGSKVLIFAGSDKDAGAYYLFDKATKSLGKLSASRPALEGMAISEMRPVTYPARDGTPIPAYLTLPPGKADAKGLPAIIMPHGGPSARDNWGFDWLSQYFAQLGYAVLQPNYRGSAGYGTDWFQENGFKAWRTSVGDINDGARWLVSQGIAAPQRLAIFGWSYGGYAALQANVLEPTLYKATIAVAPVTDLAMLKEQSRYYGNFLLTKEFIGAGPHIVQGSPARNAAAIQTPVLMFHGDKDLNVEVRQSRLMESQLKNAGKAVELIVYPELQHSLIDSGARTDMLTRSANFLAANVK